MSFGHSPQFMVPGAGLGSANALMDQAPPAGGGPGQYEEQAPLYYTQGGKVIKQRNFVDPSTGETFPIFEEYRTLPAGINAPDGTMVDPDNIYGSIVAQQAAPPQDLAPRAPNAATDAGTPAFPPNPAGSGGAGGSMNGSQDFSPAGVAAQAQAAVTGAGAQAQNILGQGGADLNGLFKNALLYDPDNARMAVANVLRDMGINPNNSGNIFAQMVSRAAPGLGLAFQEQMAGQPAGGMNNAPGSAPPDFGGQFSQFLKSAIGGGNVLSTLHNAATALPAIIQTLRGLGQSDPSAGNVNPFAQALLDTLGANSGQGTIAALAALNGPGMSQSMMQGYTKGLTAAGQNALRAGANDNFFQSGNKDIWAYLLGI